MQDGSVFCLVCTLNHSLMMLMTLHLETLYPHYTWQLCIALMLRPPNKTKKTYHNVKYQVQSPKMFNKNRNPIKKRNQYMFISKQYNTRDDIQT